MQEMAESGDRPRGGFVEPPSSEPRVPSCTYAPAAFEWFGGGISSVMPLVRPLWLGSMLQLLATWPGAQSKAERIRADEDVDTAMVRATCGLCCAG